MEDWEATAEKLQHIAEEASMTLGRERENEVARW